MMKFVPAALLVIAMPAMAQQVPTEFPEGATVMTPEALQAAIVNKSFEVQPAQGQGWRMQFKDNGYFFVNAPRFSDSGKWSVKDSTACTEGRVIGRSCNEMRIKDNVLYLKRDSGEVVRLDPR